MLFDLAHERRGVFTLADARQAGYGRELVHYYAKRGDFTPVARGVYRLVDYPSSPEDRLAEVAAILGPQAMISHESALALFDVSDVVPRGVHVTVPRALRYGRSGISDVVLHTTIEPIGADDIVSHHGFRSTSLARSIVDSARMGTDPKLIQQAVKNGRARNILNAGDLDRNLAGAPERVRDTVTTVMSELSAERSSGDPMDGKPAKRYATSRAFEAALRAKLEPLVTRRRGFTALRKEVASDRFLARLQDVAPDSWLLKGGVALEYRLPEARPTNDIDVSVRTGTEATEIVKMLREAASRDLHDYFKFQVGEPEEIADEISSYRFLLEAKLSDGRSFEKFKMDVGFGDPWIGEPEIVTGSSILEFAGIPPARVFAIPSEVHLSEKLHAYTRDYGQRGSTRVKDLVDMALLVDHRPVDPVRLREALEATFESRATHPIPNSFPPPPREWAPVYANLAKDLPIPQNASDAHRHVAAILEPILSREHDLDRG